MAGIGFRLHCTSWYAPSIPSASTLKKASEYNNTLAELLRKDFAKDPEVQKQLQLFFENCVAVTEDVFVIGKNGLYQEHQPQIKELVALFQDPEIAAELKVLAAKCLPTSQKLRTFQLCGFSQALAILRCKTVPEAQQKIQTKQAAEERGKKYFTQRLAAKEAACATPVDEFEWDWTLDPLQENELDVYIQDRNSPLYLAQTYAHDLMDKMTKATKDKNVKQNKLLHQELEQAIGSDEYKNLMEEQLQDPKGQVTWDMVQAQLPFRNLTLSVARHLYPIPEQAFVTKSGKQCRLTAEHQVIIKEQNGTERTAALSDWRDIDFSKLHPHLRSELCIILLGGVSDKGELSEFILKLNLANIEIESTACFEFDLRSYCKNVFLRESSGGSFEAWAAKATQSDLHRIFPFLSRDADLRACFNRLKQLNSPLPAAAEMFPEHKVIFLGQEYITECYSSKAQLDTLELLCRFPVTEETKATIRESIKILLSIEQAEAPQCYKIAVFSAAATGNTVAIDLLYQMHPEVSELLLNTKDGYARPEMIAAKRGQLGVLQMILGRVQTDLIHYPGCRTGWLLICAAMPEDTNCLKYLLTQLQVQLTLFFFKLPADAGFLEQMTEKASLEASIVLRCTETTFRYLPESLLREWKKKALKRFPDKKETLDILFSRTPPALKVSKYPSFPEMGTNQLATLTRLNRADCLLCLLRENKEEKVKMLMGQHDPRIIFADVFSTHQDKDALWQTILEKKKNGAGLLRMLEDHGYKPVAEFSELMLQALILGNLDIAGYISEKHTAEAKTDSLHKWKDSAGMTLMHLAVRRNNLELVKVLHKLNAEFISCDCRCFDEDSVEIFTGEHAGDTPLITCVKADNINLEILNFLLQHSPAEVIFRTSVSGKHQEDALITVARAKNTAAAEVFYQVYNHLPESEQKFNSLQKVRTFLATLPERELEEMKNLFDVPHSEPGEYVNTTDEKLYELKAF